MIGVVAVSHSSRLAEAASELALQMVPGDAVPLRLAAGAGMDADGAAILGTDALLVAGAIDDLAAECDGVLVLMDLGSAVMSAELALELRTSDVPVRLVPAPFVEGLLAAMVSASGGADLDTVAGEAASALEAKAAQLGGDTAAMPGIPETATEPPADAAPEVVRTVRVRNALGIHARPAALIADAARGARVRLRRLPAGPEASAGSLSRLLTLGVRGGDEVQLRAAGDDAEAAVARIAALFEEGFGEQLVATPEAPDARQDTAPAASIDGADAGDAGAYARADPRVPAGAVLRGRGVSPGVAVGPVVRLATPVGEPPAGGTVPAADRESEAARIAPASSAVAKRLADRAEAAHGETRAILDATRMLASDPDLMSEAAERVRSQGVTAARAVWEVASEQAAALETIGGRTGERAADIRDVRDRIVAELLGVAAGGIPQRDDAFVLVAADLSPADTAALAHSRCAALVTEQSGPTSHTAIIARALGLPAVVAVPGALGIPDGATILVDGESGEVGVEPSADAIAEARAAAEPPPFRPPGRLVDGTPVPLLANVGGAEDAAVAADAGAEGVGLFRTEFCFLGRAAAPDVGEQIAAYRPVLAAFAGRRVVVRTLDAGADKPLPFVAAGHEENPALGVRGVRVGLRQPALLHDQLRALAAAAESEGAQVEVMAPMIATVDEASRFAEAARAAGLPRVGVMIETPAAALMAEELFQVVDFASIGTNDLAQYTMAADRMHPALGELNDPWQPAVLRLIAAVGSAGQAVGAPVGVCGEAAGDPRLAPVLVGLGVTSLSMTPRALGRVSLALGALSVDDCVRAADAAVAAGTAEEARAVASDALG